MSEAEAPADERPIEKPAKAPFSSSESYALVFLTVVGMFAVFQMWLMRGFLPYVPIWDSDDSMRILSVRDLLADDLDAVLPHARGHRQPLATANRATLAPVLAEMAAEGLPTAPLNMMSVELFDESRRPLAEIRLILEEIAK